MVSCFMPGKRVTVWIPTMPSFWMFKAHLDRLLDPQYWGMGKPAFTVFIKNKEDALFTLVDFQVCLSRQINLHPFFYAHMNLKKEEKLNTSLIWLEKGIVSLIKTGLDVVFFKTHKTFS